jgi:FG-GAP-like repeat
MTFRTFHSFLTTALAALVLLGCGGGGGSGLIPPPLAVEASSYGNKNSISFDQPQVTGVTNSIAASLTLGDFAQEGAYSAFVAVGQQAGVPKASFYRKSGSGWSEISGLLTGTNKDVCNNIIQAITADFNGDGKPDVYVVCGGNAKQVFFMSQGKEYVRQESSFTLTDSWGAAAGDLDGDGDVDLVLTNIGFTYAYLNDGQKLGAASFGSLPSEGRIPKVATGNVDFPTQHRKVFLLPRIGRGPDLVIGGDGASNNYKTMILLKNDSGYFYANADSPSTFNSFEGYPIATEALKPLDLVETSRFLYVLARDTDISAAVTAQTNLFVLRYELPANNNPAISILNLTAADGTNTTNEASFAVFKQTTAPSDGLVSQFKPVNGKLVAYDGGCQTLANRCAFSVTAP